VLRAAAWSGKPGIVAACLDQGLMPDRQPGRGALRPLDIPVSVEVVRQLVEAGADPRRPSASDGTAPLHRSRSASVAAYLLSLAVPVDPVDREGRTPLLGAVGRDDIELVDVLLEAGSDRQHGDRFERNALFYAHSPEMVRHLLSTGVAVRPMHHGISPIDGHLWDGSVAVARALGWTGEPEATRIGGAEVVRLAAGRGWAVASRSAPGRHCVFVARLDEQGVLRPHGTMESQDVDHVRSVAVSGDLVAVGCRPGRLVWARLSPERDPTWRVMQLRGVPHKLVVDGRSFLAALEQLPGAGLPPATVARIDIGPEGPSVRWCVGVGEGVGALASAGDGSGRFWIVVDNAYPADLVGPVDGASLVVEPPVETWEHHGWRISDVAVAGPDRVRTVEFDAGGRLRVTDRGSGGPRQLLDEPLAASGRFPVHVLARDGRRLVAADGATVAIVRVDDGFREATLVADRVVTAVASVDDAGPVLLADEEGLTSYDARLEHITSRLAWSAF
jgi:hypothetical protein